VVYGLVITGLAVGVLSLQAKLDHIARVERAAQEIINNRRMHYTEGGFIQAGLSFLERHRKDFPETYERAKQLCEAHDCIGTQYGKKDGVEGLRHSWGLIELASVMEGILRGLSAMYRAG